jgi:GNAT superfamily N-acetyltransferase
MNLIIEPLNKYPEHCNECIKWAYEQWHKENNTRFSLVESDYQKRARNGNLPFTYIGLSDNELVGMVSLKKHDLNTRKDLSPWLSALYVKKDFRKKGVGRSLIYKVVRLGIKLNFKTIYLFIDRNDSDYLLKYYQKLGWTFFDTSLDLQNYEVTILSYDLSLVY